MESVKFTVIIPAYNVENYLSKCLDSVLRQSYKNFEIILINDGSTDDTGMICDNYEEKDDRIRVIHKENGGLSDARNTGIEIIKGNYVIFVDSDDYIDIDALYHFNEKLKSRPDILITKLVQTYDEGTSIEMDTKMSNIIEENPSKINAIDWVFNKSQNTWPAPKYIISTSLIKDNNIRFKLGFLHEDLDWTTNIFYYARTFSTFNLPWYYHRMGRIGSITTTSNFKRAIDVITIAEEHIRDTRYDNVDRKIKIIMFNRLMKSVYAILSQYKLANSHGRSEIARCLTKNKHILKYAPCLRHKIFSATTKIVGEKKALDIMSILS